MAAAAAGWQDGVQMLLEARANVAACDYTRKTSLHAASQMGNHRLVKLLLGAKADVNAKDVDSDRDPRFSSISQEETPDKHRTPLHYAAALGNLLTARALLEAGAEINAGDSTKHTPLHLCASARGDEMDFEAGVGVRVDGLQKKPEWNGKLGSIIESKPSGDSGLPRWPVLLDGEEQPSLLKADNLRLLPEEILDLLLEAGADPNLGNGDWGEGRTLLHEAALAGDLNLARKVLAHGAKMNSQDKKSGFSALHLASRAKKDEMVRFLVDAKADFNLQSVAGITAAELGEKNGLSAGVLATLRGEAANFNPPPEQAAPQTLDSLTPEQRAALFID